MNLKNTEAMFEFSRLEFKLWNNKKETKNFKVTKMTEFIKT